MPVIILYDESDKYDLIFDLSDELIVELEGIVVGEKGFKLIRRSVTKLYVTPSTCPPRLRESSSSSYVYILTSSHL